MWAAERAWEAILSTRATTAAGVLWKIGVALKLALGDAPPDVCRELAGIGERVAGGRPAWSALESLARRLGGDLAGDLVRSAAADAAALEAHH